MAFGLLFYVVYRKVFEGTTLTKRVSVPERALTKQVPEVEFRNILVPVFGTKLDDDIVATAGRLAAAEQAESASGEDDAAARRRLRDRSAADRCRSTRSCRPSARRRRSGRWSGPARSARSTRTSSVSTEVIRARKVGAGIVEAARRSGAEAIVIGGEPPTKIRGGGDDRRHRRRQAGRDRRRHRVRAEEGALPGAADRAAGDS